MDRGAFDEQAHVLKVYDTFCTPPGGAVVENDYTVRYMEALDRSTRTTIFREIRRNKNAGNQYYEAHAQGFLRRRRLAARGARRPSQRMEPVALPLC